MEIAFLRHGQTAANTNHVHQVPDEPLTADGIEQVLHSIPELKAWQPTHIVASPLARARHSAHLVGDAIGCEVKLWDELRELRRPLALYGKGHLAPASVWYILKWFFGPFEHTNTIVEGESYPAFLRRLERARSLLEQYPDDARVLVVSHSIFINLFTAHVCSMEGLTFPQAVRHFINIMTHKNARVTYLSFSPSDQPGLCQWQQVTPEPTVITKPVADTAT